MKPSTNIVIIGAGPYGLSLAAHLRSRGVEHRIFGLPMQSWAAHMPKTMRLKSEGLATSLYAPESQSSFKAWCSRNGVPYAERGWHPELADFLSYSDEFQTRYVPHLEPLQVNSLQHNGTGFCLGLQGGEHLSAARVVLAIGLKWFNHIPPELATLPREFGSHSYQHREGEEFRAKEVTIIGAGATAIDLADMLLKSGACVRLIVRGPRVDFTPTPVPVQDTWRYRLNHPPSPIGGRWRSYFCAANPQLVHCLPHKLRERANARHSQPAGGWFMRSSFIQAVLDKRLNLMVDTTVTRAEVAGAKVALEVRNGHGNRERLECDHVISATGYRVDLARVGFLCPLLRARIALSGGSPRLSSNFETSVGGLYALGVLAMDAFGPVMKFMVGARYSSPRLAAVLEANSQRENYGSGPAVIQPVLEPVESGKDVYA